MQRYAIEHTISSRIIFKPIAKVAVDDVDVGLCMGTCISTNPLITLGTAMATGSWIFCLQLCNTSTRNSTKYYIVGFHNKSRYVFRELDPCIRDVELALLIWVLRFAYPCLYGGITFKKEFRYTLSRMEKLVYQNYNSSEDEPQYSDD